VGGQRFGPGLGQADLTHGGGRLFLLQPQPSRQAERLPGQGDGAGGDDDHLGAAGAGGGDVGGHAVEPGGSGGAGFGDEGAAEFDDEEACPADGWCHAARLMPSLRGRLAKQPRSRMTAIRRAAPGLLRKCSQ